ncbi:MAG TPA: hemerythrin domain-containing protein, partial [Pseudonocardiaceae bacterium]|nr:hemerythrin domain-containing protein [Pseudonocardiaceae bacterium]
TVMRRGAVLTAAATGALAAGEPVRVSALVRLARWQSAFVHHHHASEDELFWPVLRTLFPETIGELDGLTEEHETLDAELGRLTAAIDRIATCDPVEAVGVAALHAQPAAEIVRDVLAMHLDNEEPVLNGLFPQVPDGDIRDLRKAIVAGAPRSGPDLVLGLLQDPEPAPGHDTLLHNFPPPVRWLRPVLLRRYNARKAALALAGS